MIRLAPRPVLVLAALGWVIAGCEATPVADPDPPGTTASITTTTVTTTTVPSPPPTDPPAEHHRAADLPEPLTEVAGTVWGGRIFVVGGLDSGGNAVARVDVYDPDTDSWDRGPDLPVALHHTGVAVLGDRLYVVGGYSIEGGRWVQQAAVWSLGPGEVDWRPEADLGTARGALAVASAADRLVAIGGVGPGGVVLTTTEMLHAGADAWEPGPDMGTSREHLAATAVGDEVYAIAGRAGGLATNRTSVEVLRGGAWEPAGDLTFSRGGIGAATVHGTPCVAGGEEPGGTIGSIECLIGGEWRVVAQLEEPRHGLVVAALGGALHVIGGGPLPGLTTSGVHEVVPISAP